MLPGAGTLVLEGEGKNVRQVGVVPFPIPPTAIRSQAVRRTTAETSLAEEDPWDEGEAPRRRKRKRKDDPGVYERPMGKNYRHVK